MSVTESVTGVHGMSECVGCETGVETKPIPYFRFVANSITFLGRIGQTTWEFVFESVCYSVFYMIEVVFLWRDYYRATEKLMDTLFLYSLELMAIGLYFGLSLAYAALNRKEALISYATIREKLWNYDDLALDEMVVFMPSPVPQSPEGNGLDIQPDSMPLNQELDGEARTGVSVGVGVGTKPQIILSASSQKATALSKLMAVGEISETTEELIEDMVRPESLTSHNNNHNHNHRKLLLVIPPGTDADSVGSNSSNRFKQFFKGTYQQY